MAVLRQPKISTMRLYVLSTAPDLIIWFRVQLITL